MLFLIIDLFCAVPLLIETCFHFPYQKKGPSNCIVFNGLSSFSMITIPGSSCATAEV